MDTIFFQTQLQVKIPMENPLGNHDHEEPSAAYAESSIECGLLLIKTAA